MSENPTPRRALSLARSRPARSYRNAFIAASADLPRPVTGALAPSYERAISSAHADAAVSPLAASIVAA